MISDHDWDVHVKHEQLWNPVSKQTLHHRQFSEVYTVNLTTITCITTIKCRELDCSDLLDYTRCIIV